MANLTLASSTLNIHDLQVEASRLNKIIHVLMDRIERNANIEASDFNLFQTTVMLEDQVHSRTIELEGSLRENVRITQALRETEQRYRGIFDEAIVGVFQSEPRGRFLSVNAFMAHMLGYESPDEMTASITDVSSQFYVDPKRMDELYLLLDQCGGVQNFECAVYKKEHGTIWITTSVRAVIRDGITIRYEGMIEDITERNALREQLLQSQKLESVGQLAAGIAHEINTPTQFIGDNLGFLLDAFGSVKNLLEQLGHFAEAAKCKDMSTAPLEQVAQMIEAADVGYFLDEIPNAIQQALEGVKRVSTLVSAMKEFSHPATKEKALVDLNHAIESTITVARNEWKYVSDLETEFDRALPLVSCLPSEFNQVILNLIVNAAQAVADTLPGNGSAKGKIYVRTKAHADWVEVQIEDTGTGIPQQIRNRVFDPFFTTKGVGKGTGQGLAIARSIIVDKHRGSIQFESEEGKGTTFVIRIPYMDTPILSGVQET